MGLSSIKIAGADSVATNSDGSNYAGTLQASEARCFLHKVSFSPLSGMAADVYAWIYDAAAGATSDADPVAVRWIAAGVADTWDPGAGGSLFVNGIYVVLSTAAPTDATTTPAATLSGADKVILRAEYRKV